jgi:probable rRNA maturation factor
MRRRHPDGVSAVADPGPSSTGTRERPGQRLEIEVMRRAELWDRSGVGDGTLSLAALAAFEAAPPPPGSSPYEVTIVLTDDGEVRDLNRTWRGKDTPTNVLSFPAGETPVETPGEPSPLGDVVLAGETVVEEAKLKGVSVADHASHLVVHGVLHLLGHDHEHDEAAERMETLETAILARLGIADPYADLGAVAEASP